MQGKYETAEDAAFACDLCKQVVFAFRVSVDSRVQTSLPTDVFESRCRAVGLNPSDPVSFCDSEYLPAGFKAFVKEYRPYWEASLQRRGLCPLFPTAPIDHSPGPSSKELELLAQGQALNCREDRLRRAPEGWWKNLLIACVKGGDKSLRALERLAPSLCDTYSDSPKLFEKVDAAREALRVARGAVAELEIEIRKEPARLHEEIQAHARAKKLLEQNVT